MSLRMTTTMQIIKEIVKYQVSPNRFSKKPMLLEKLLLSLSYVNE
jgi:hypothetical protein